MGAEEYNSKLDPLKKFVSLEVLNCDTGKMESYSMPKDTFEIYAEKFDHTGNLNTGRKVYEAVTEILNGRMLIVDVEEINDMVRLQVV